MDAADLAYMQVSTGAMSYDQAIRAAVKKVAADGLSTISYGNHTDHLDVAVRRTVLTGVGQTVGELQMRRADEMGVDLITTSAHIGARNHGEGPMNHEGWQGRIFSRSGTHSKYPDFVKSTGYGTVVGLAGINCRHSFYPFFEGISQAAYDQATLDDYASKTVTYNGQEISVYDATQKQRAIEREIRKAKREAGALEAAGLDNSEEKARVKGAQARMRDFIGQTGLSRQPVREQVIKAEATVPRVIDFESTNPQLVSRLGDVQKHYSVDDPGFKYVVPRPVYYNNYGAGHLTDEDHKHRLTWLKEHSVSVIKAINPPDFIEKSLRVRDDGHFSSTQIVKLPDDPDGKKHYMAVAVSLSQELGSDHAYHQITTIYPIRHKNLFDVNGNLKDKYVQIK